MKHQVPLLAVDGGGTKCLAVLADRDGNVLGAGQAGGCNYHGAGRDAAVRELAEALRLACVDARNREAVADAPVVDVACAAFAMAGLDTERDREVIVGIVRDALQEAGIRVRRLLTENDGLAVLLGSTGGKPGVLVISGTGSVVYGVDGRGNRARAGGWGHRVGDEGSGYWIGKQALTAVLRAYDGRSEETALTELLSSHLGISHPEELMNWTYGGTYSVEGVAGLAPLVDRAAANGDRVARRILRAAAGELFDAVQSVVRALNLEDKPFSVLLKGGVLKHDNLVRRSLIRRLRRRWPYAAIEKSACDPIRSVISWGLSFLKSAQTVRTESDADDPVKVKGTAID